MKNKLKRDAMFEQLVSPMNLEKNSSNASAGFSLVEALLAMFILGIIGLGISRMSELGFKSAASAGIRQDLQTLKWTIREQMSCEKTLDLPAGYDPSVPVPCTGSKLTLKKRDGTAFGNPLGSLTWSASCVGKKIQVMVSSEKKDPLTQQTFAPRDLFGGIAEGLCSSYFTGTSCPTGETVIGNAGSTPVCGKAPVPVGPADYYVTRVWGSPESGKSCAGAGTPSIATCPDGWIAVSCGYNLSQWFSGGSYDSNAPDSSYAIGTTQCLTIAGGRPGKSGCFKSVATCLNLSKIANGK